MSLPFQSLSPNVWASGQISAATVEEAARQGIRRIVCNRPDDEDAGQPPASEIAAAARAAGLQFLDVPVAGLPGLDAVAAVAAALRDETPTLMYCRSGMRSAAIWAMAMRALGRGEPDDLRASAAAAGYDLGRIAL